MPVAQSGGDRVIEIKPLHTGGKPVVFPSLMTQYEDTWTPQWRPEFVYGRMDPISFYGGTDRKVSIGFRVISEDLSEATSNMRSIQRLIQMQYPTYKTDTNLSTIKAPPYFKVTLETIRKHFYFLM